jgi:hypothetical protein
MPPHSAATRSRAEWRRGLARAGLSAAARGRETPSAAVPAGRSASGDPSPWLPYGHVQFTPLETLRLAG